MYMQYVLLSVLIPQTIVHCCQDATGDLNADMAIQDPCRFVMKPQREGGGNNVFDEEIATALTSLRGSPERNAYILMDRIRPLRFHNYIVK